MRDTVGLGTAGIFRCVLDRADSDTLSYETGRHILTRTRASNYMEAQESIERHADAYRPGLQPILESVCDRLEEVPLLWL